jgi:hypothetical protein
MSRTPRYSLLPDETIASLPILSPFLLVHLRAHVFISTPEFRKHMRKLGLDEVIAQDVRFQDASAASAESGTRDSRL